MGKCETFTRDEMIDMICVDIISKCNEDDKMLHNILRNGLTGFNAYVSGLTKKTDTEICIIWCEHASEVYFSNNTDVDDVLMLCSDRPEKMWVCSRNEIEERSER